MSGVGGFSEDFLQTMVPPHARQYWRGNREERDETDAREEEITCLHKENAQLKAEVKRLTEELQKVKEICK